MVTLTMKDQLAKVLIGSNENPILLDREGEHIGIRGTGGNFGHGNDVMALRPQEIGHKDRCTLIYQKAKHGLTLHLMGRGSFPRPHRQRIAAPP
jgi:hypothetical protein